LCENATRIIEDCHLRDYVTCSQKTVGVNTVRVELSKDSILHLTDVGGTSTERSKRWPHVKSNQHQVLFFVALSEFHKKAWEDDDMNRLELSLSIFENLCSDPKLVDTPFTLILTKPDVLVEMIADKTVPFGRNWDPELISGMELVRSDNNLNVIVNTIIKQFLNVFNKHRGKSSRLSFHIVNTIVVEEVSQLSKILFGSSLLHSTPYISPCLHKDRTPPLLTNLNTKQNNFVDVELTFNK